MIQIQDVSFEYEKEQGTLSHIDLNIQQGECVVLTGESGCGKTTVTKLINGLIPHFVEDGTLSGRAIVNDMEVSKTEMYHLAEDLCSKIRNLSFSILTRTVRLLSVWKMRVSNQRKSKSDMRPLFPP